MIMIFCWLKHQEMELFKLNKRWIGCCLMLLLKFTNGMAQEVVINNVSIENVSATSFKVKYKLNAVADHKYQSVRLTINRRREGKVEEVFSDDITPAGTELRANQTYSYSWETDAKMVKDGDQFQATIQLLYTKPVMVEPPPVINLPPKANAGGNITVQLPLNLVVILDGIRSYDEDGKIVSVKWRQMSGPNTLRIASPTSYKSYVTGEFKAGVYTFELSVTDDKGDSATDRSILTVKAAPTVQAKPETAAPAAVSVKKKDSAIVQQAIRKRAMPELKGGPNNALLSVLLPGVGHYFVSGDQYGNDRKPNVFIITALYAGSVGGAVYYKLRSDREYKKYIDLSNYREYQKDANGNIIGVRGVSQAQATQHLSAAKNSHNNFLILTGISAGIMAADVIYTFIRGSKNKKIWEEEAKGTTRFFISPNSTGLAFGVQVKL
jgi:hypothetical protein